MKPLKPVLVVFTLLCLLAGCSTKRDLIARTDENHRELIVLLSDADGKVGSLQVTTEGGSQALEEPGYSTQIEDISKPPTVPQPLDDNEITTVFGPALSAQPDDTGRYFSFLLYFERDTSNLTHQSLGILSEVVRTIKSQRSNEVYVVGHTDRVGTQEYNRELSSRRANYVRDQLVFKGVNSGTLFVSFHGEETPLIRTEDEVPEPLNRRVEVIVR